MHDVGEAVVIPLVDPDGDRLFDLDGAHLSHPTRVPQAGSRPLLRHRFDFQLPGLVEGGSVRRGQDPRLPDADQRFRLALETFREFIARAADGEERCHLEHLLAELALVDDVTGLHNRRSFILLAEQALKEAARAGRPAIALFIDVDGLKPINDNYGHQEGNRALRLVAGALRAACRGSDIIGRLSGDEFAIVLAEAQELDGLEGRVRRRVEEAAGECAYELSVSIGVARCEAGSRCNLAELFELADRAMYVEKGTKRAQRQAAESSG